MKLIRTVALVLFSLPGFAQDDLMKELEKSEKPEKEYVHSTFKGTRLVNGQTVETKGKGALEFIFQHRFGKLNSGLYNFYGLDIAHVRIGLEYGLTDRLGIGLGRNSFDKTVDSYLRYKLAQQSTGAGAMPITITAYGNVAMRTSPPTQDAGYPITTEDRLAYTGQLLIARKFSSRFSAQLMPSMVHKNMVSNKASEPNDQFALGMGTRMKITRSVALTSEYYYRLNVSDKNPNYNVLGFGVDIETGGHVFQLVLTNASNSFTERGFITETTDNFFKGGIHLGFNVTRTFQLKKQK